MWVGMFLSKLSIHLKIIHLLSIYTIITNFWALGIIIKNKHQPVLALLQCFYFNFKPFFKLKKFLARDENLIKYINVIAVDTIFNF